MIDEAPAVRRPSYTELSDERLAILARSDELAMDHILERYRLIVRKKVQGYFIVGQDKDDVFQEGMIGLYKAVRDFNADKLANFRTFAEMCVARQIITSIKKATRRKHEVLNRSLSMDATSTVSRDDRYHFERRIPIDTKEPMFYLEREAFARELQDIITKTLSPLEADVLRSYLRTSSYGDISMELGCGMKRVDNALQRAKRKLGHALAEILEA
jgi:RNA polymerase sporulation-specific sigma factor